MPAFHINGPPATRLAYDAIKSHLIFLCLGVEFAVSAKVSNSLARHGQRYTRKELRLLGVKFE